MSLAPPSAAPAGPSRRQPRHRLRLALGFALAALALAALALAALTLAALTLVVTAGPLPARAGSQDDAAGVSPVRVEARPLDHFEVRQPARTRFGALRFRSGLVLTSSDPRFGGWSGLARPGDGRRLVAISDRAQWLVATPVYAGERLTGLAEATIAPILSATGLALARTRSFDTESLSIAGGAAYIGVERSHEVLRFEWARDGLLARAQPIPVPPAVKRLPANRGLEAVGVAPPASPIAGAVVAIAERSDGPEAPTRGFILSGPQRGEFLYRRQDEFDVTDLAFLANGDMLVLERFYAPWRGVGMRIRRVEAAAIKPGALLDGTILIDADLGDEIDNMEGMSLHRDQATGETIVTLISDDNFSAIQRTVLIEFALVGAEQAETRR